MMAQISTYHQCNYSNPPSPGQVFDKEPPEKLRDGLTEAWLKTVSIDFRCLISHKNPVKGWVLGIC